MEKMNIKGFLLGLFFSLSTALWSQENLIQCINEHRIEIGACELEEELLLSKTALSYSQELKARGVLSHKDLSGKRAAQRFYDHSGMFNEVGEILGAGPEVDDIFAAWLKSPSHKALLEDPSWKYIGYGITPYSGGILVVVLFY